MFFGVIQFHIRNQFPVAELVLNSHGKLVIKFISPNQPDFHFGRMHIHIQHIRLHGKMQHKKRKLMLHQISLVSFLHGLCDNIIFNIASINKISFKISVRAVDFRLPQKSADRKKLPFPGKGYKSLCDVSPVDAVNDLL